MAWPRRLHDFSVHRVPENAETDGPLHVDRVYGQIENIAGGVVVHGINTSEVGNAQFRYPNRRESLSDLTFEIHQANDNPESLGRARVVLRIVDSYDEENGDEISPIVEYTGFFQQVGRTRSRTTDSPRAVTFIPQIIARGGDANRQNVTPVGCTEYLDTITQVYRTRLDGVGPSIDHTLATRRAHGVSV